MLGVYGFAPKPPAASYRLDCNIVTATDGTFVGYSGGGYTGSPLGSVDTGAVSPSGALDFIGDQIGNNAGLAIAIDADPGAGYITDVLVDGVSMNASIGAPISYSGYSGGYAVWAWPATFGFASSTGYNIKLVS